MAYSVRSRSRTPLRRQGFAWRDLTGVGADRMYISPMSEETILGPQRSRHHRSAWTNRGQPATSKDRRNRCR